ncbi:MAG: D-alanine--D-alanine ligase [Candidatus Saccharimonadales bacterium]
MQKINKHIQIIRTTVPGLSSLSSASAEAIQAALAKHYRMVQITIVNDIKDLEQLVSCKPDLVFTGIKYLLGRLGRKIWIADYLEEHNLLHTGSPKRAIQFEQSKQLAKRCVQAAGLKTAGFKVVREGQLPVDFVLEFPVFVKPTSLGGGQGINPDSVVHSHRQLKRKLAELNCDALVESYLAGREFSVAILRNEGSHVLVAMPIELVAPLNHNGDRILGQAVKTADSEVVSRVEDNFTRLLLCDFATRAFKALGGQDYGRIDIRMDSQGEPHFLEANLIPSLIEDYGSFPRACQLNQGIGYQQMILRIVSLGLNGTDRIPLNFALSSSLEV